ncbi:MAG TPA: penicillin acylase family protein [Candidatus Acidoferrales bacterium]|nr:penicillin acylase family protein [Candidatus Acidoferrales bacterium]
MTRGSRIARNVVAALLVLAGVALLCGWWLVHRPLPRLDGQITVAGLKEGVIVDRDQWGRPWIRAKSTEDLVMAQGYVLAQDRLWQMDLLRRAAAGDLSEIVGPAALKIDEENRILGMRQAAERAAKYSSPEIGTLLESYARGVNQYIAQQHDRLPIEFSLLGYAPRPWTPADTYLIDLYMWKTLTSTWKSKLNRQWVTAKVGAERAAQMFVEDSPFDHYIVGQPEGGAAPSGAQGLRKVTSNLPKLFPGEAAPFAEQAGAEAIDFLAQFEEESSEIIGSNNFVVSGAHTASRKPLLANDTHLALSVPCIWYLVHLTAPGWNVEGFALPGAPLVIIGHNERIAWGFTNSNADVQSLYAETFDSKSPLNYRANGKWLPAEVRKEKIPVRGKADVELDVTLTRHGPIVYREAENDGGHAYALRWSALEPGGLDFGFPLLGRAGNWSEFIEVTRNISGPGQNTIYADVDGNIGFTIPARIPIRAGGNGALPVPGDTDEFDWKGYIPFEELPRILNPPDGIIATANARSVGPAYKHFLSDRQAGPFRTERIYQLLSGRTDLKPEDMNAIQNDIVSLPNQFLASQLLTAAHSTPPKDPRTQRLISGLIGWDAKAKADSIETSFVELTRHAVFHNLLAAYLGDETSKYELWEPRSLYNDVWWRDKVFLENILMQRPPEWLPKGVVNYDVLLISSANDAVTALAKETGTSDVSRWQWGKFHPLNMLHPLGRTGALHALLSIGPYADGGTLDTVKAMGVGHGPAMRMVSDLANFDNSFMEITSGESGQAASPHYRDQFQEWFHGRGISAPFREAAEEKMRAHRLMLVPTGGSAASGGMNGE